MSKNKISVIIPVYKVEKYLNRCVESVINQTHKNLEIILVDDGSPDNCPVLCDEWAKKDKRIIAVHKENGGVSSARNKGLEHATGEFIQFVDSDDYIESTFCEELINCFKDDVDLVVSGFTIVDDDKNVKITSEETRDATEILSSCDSFMSYLTSGYNDMPVNKLYRKNLITKQFLEGLPLGEDRIFNLDYLLNVKNKIIISSAKGYVYEFNQGSACHKTRDDFYEILSVSLQALKEFLINKFNTYDNQQFYKITGDTFSSIVKRNSKKTFKFLKNKIINDENFKIYIKNYKPETFKEKIKLFLFKHEMFRVFKLINGVRKK